MGSRLVKSCLVLSGLELLEGDSLMPYTTMFMLLSSAVLFNGIIVVASAF